MKNKDSQPQIEVEIKSLLGTFENAKEFVDKITADDRFALVSETKQLNHYFENGSFPKLIALIRENGIDNTELDKMSRMSRTQSVRTRDANGHVKIVIKATIDDTTSENGIQRLELEIPFEGQTIQHVDDIVLRADYRYQAKWSRLRKEFQCNEYTICLDQNAGYGYLTEFECVTDDAKKVGEITTYLRSELCSFGLKELSQERLQRMFEYYNQHWKHYYGTNKIFTIE